MFHGLSNQFLYAAYKITATFVDSIGNVKSGQGTCFFVKNKKDQLCLITNRHVVDITYGQSDESLKAYTLKELKVAGKIGGGGQNTPTSDFYTMMVPNVRYASNSADDVAGITTLIPIEGNGTRIDYFVPHSLLATESVFQNDLTICDVLAFPGFPEWHDKKENRPILRVGTISSDPRFNYSYKDLVGGNCVAYEAFSFDGSSGSPVFAVQKGIEAGAGLDFPGFRRLFLVGINAGHFKTVDHAHSGISYFYKSTTILELIDQ